MFNVVLDHIFSNIFDNSALITPLAGIPVNIISISSYICIVFISFLIVNHLIKKQSILKITIIFLCIEFTKILNIFAISGFDISRFFNRYNYFQFLTNHSMTQSYLFLFILSISFFIILKTYLSQNKLRNSNIDKKLLASYIITIVILLSNLNVVLVSEALQSTWLRNINNIRLLGLLRIGFFYFIFLQLFNLGVYTVLKGFSDIKRKTSSIHAAFATSISFALVFNFLVQYVIFVSGHNQRYRGLIIQVIIMSIVFLSIYLITNKYLLSTYINFILSALLILGNYFKFKSRLEPITLDDIAWLNDIPSLLAFSTGVNIPLLIFILCILIISYIILSKYIFKNKMINSIQKRIIITVFFVGVSYGFYNNMNDAISNLQIRQSRSNLPTTRATLLERVMRATPFWRGTNALASRESFSLLLLQQRLSTVMFTPNDYSKEKMEEIQTRYTKIASEINKDRSKDITDQTIIYILSESLSNPTRLPYFTLSENPTPFIDTLVKKTGGLHISTGFGGGTANVEFQALTGLSLNVFDNSITVAYNAVVPNMNYFPTISKLFDDKIVIHPVDALSYNRLSIYMQAGYREFIANNNGTINLRDPEKFGDYVSDAYSYQLVLDNLDQNTNQFINLITMQNHTPFNLVNNPKNITFTDNDSSLNDNRATQFINYLTLINETDNATYNFLNELKKYDKNITVVLYGDHLPGLYPQSIFNNTPQLERLTEYFIWNNKEELPQIKENVSSSYEFIPQLLDVTNSKVSPYQSLLTLLKEKLPVMQNNLFYDRVEGNISESYDFTQQQQQLLDDYELIHYDLTVGKGYLDHDFYEKIVN